MHRFTEKHGTVIKDFDFKYGDLVLVRNSRIDKSLNRKMRPRYIGPYIVISRNKGGAYILAELDGSVLARPIGAFRLVPYHPRRSLELPDLEHLLDITTDELRARETSLDQDDEMTESDVVLDLD